MKTWGFARSFINESEATNSLQIDTLLAAGAEEIVYDYQLCNRKKVSLFEKLLDMTESGDTIVVTEICRMCSTALEFRCVV